MALTTEAQLHAAIERAQYLALYKPGLTAEGAGTWHSFWKSAGRPGAGATPTVFSTVGTDFRPTKETTGAMEMANGNPISGAKLIVTEARAQKSQVAGLLTVYDRLWACSGFDTTLLTAQTITAGATYPVNRGAANGAGVEPWLEVYTAPGATGATWTVNFQDQVLGGVGSATYVHPANAETLGQMMPMTLADGTKSVYYPIDFTCSSSSGTAGDIGITLLRPILQIPMWVINVERIMGYLETGLAEIPNNACLALHLLCQTSVTGTIYGQLQVAEN